MAHKFQIVNVAHKLARITAEERLLALAYLERYPAAGVTHAISYALLQGRK